MLSGIGNQSADKPLRQIEQDRILQNLLQAASEYHIIEQHLCHALFHLPSQIAVVAVEVYKDLVSDNFGMPPDIRIEFYSGADIALVQIRDVIENENLNSCAQFIVQQFFEMRQLFLSHLHHIIAQILPSLIEISHKMLGLKKGPDKIVILHTVFSKFHIDTLRKETDRQEGRPKEQKHVERGMRNLHEGNIVSKFLKMNQISESCTKRKFHDAYCCFHIQRI